MVLLRNVREAGCFVRDRSRVGGNGSVVKVKPKTLRSRKFAGTYKGGLTYQGELRNGAGRLVFSVETEGVCEGSLPWQMSSVSDTTCQGAVDGK